ncbi:glycosyltransferase [Photobacterium alginatilyticum]|uniref:Glycosyltransferase n=2 Tax=Photobacterium alginatilyticum TaxID=1775171 RepID=A0ABW9YD30_9GAMM|nr:glycosyltransferase [Photobacterium alginatilyticum]
MRSLRIWLSYQGTKMDTNQPKVAVSIACYNHEKYIESCLASVLEQTYKNIVIFVSDDCSTDRTAEVLNNFVDSNKNKYPISINIKSQNTGVAENFNSVVEMALNDKEVEYIIPFAGDDLMFKTKVERQVEALEANKERHLCYSNMQWFNSSTSKTILNHFNFLFKPSENIEKVIAEAIIPTPTLCFRRVALEKLKYNQKLRYVNDYLIAVEAALLGGVVYIPELLVRYRKHGASIMDTTLFLEERVDAANYIIEHYGYESSARHFAETARFDYLIQSLNKGNYKDVIIRFTLLLPRFFSSQKWFFRLLKFFSLSLKRVF